MIFIHSNNGDLDWGRYLPPQTTAAAASPCRRGRGWPRRPSTPEAADRRTAVCGCSGQWLERHPACRPDLWTWVWPQRYRPSTSSGRARSGWNNKERCWFSGISKVNAFKTSIFSSFIQIRCLISMATWWWRIPSIRQKWHFITKLCELAYYTAS